MRERLDMLVVFAVGMVVVALDRVTGFVSRAWEFSDDEGRS